MEDKQVFMHMAEEDKRDEYVTGHEIKLINQSCVLLTDKFEELGKHFFDNLFEFHPVLEPMFAKNRELQEKHFEFIVINAVNNINRLDELLPALYKLGKTHLDYGVKIHHFQLVKASFLLALENCLRGEIDTQSKLAWSTYYDLIAKHIVKGMESNDTPN